MISGSKDALMVRAQWTRRPFSLLSFSSHTSQLKLLYNLRINQRERAHRRDAKENYAHLLERRRRPRWPWVRSLRLLLQALWISCPHHWLVLSLPFFVLCLCLAVYKLRWLQLILLTVNWVSWKLVLGIHGLMQGGLGLRGLTNCVFEHVGHCKRRGGAQYIWWIAWEKTLGENIWGILIWHLFGGSRWFYVFFFLSHCLIFFSYYFLCKRVQQLLKHSSMV